MTEQIDPAMDIPRSSSTSCRLKPTRVQTDPKLRMRMGALTRNQSLEKYLPEEDDVAAGETGGDGKACPEGAARAEPPPAPAKTGLPPDDGAGTGGTALNGLGTVPAPAGSLGIGSARGRRGLYVLTKLPLAQTRPVLGLPYLRLRVGTVSGAIRLRMAR